MFYFAVIDTETTFSNEVMSIGIVIANSEDMEPIVSNYYLVDPYYKMPSMYSDRLYIVDKSNTLIAQRADIILSIKALLQKYNTRAIMAYNATFDRNHLPELQSFEWYDIMKIAAYRQYNRFLPANADYYASGRLKSGYTVNDIMRYLNPYCEYLESHNAFHDAIDELRIVKLLKVDFSQYEAARIRTNSSNTHTVKHSTSTKSVHSHNSKQKENTNYSGIDKTEYNRQENISYIRKYAAKLRDEYINGNDYSFSETLKKLAVLHDHYSSDEIITELYSWCLVALAFTQKTYKGRYEICELLYNFHNQFPNNINIVGNYAHALARLCEYMSFSECVETRGHVYSLYKSYGNNEDIRDALIEIEKQQALHVEKRIGKEAYLAAKKDLSTQPQNMAVIKKYANALCYYLDISHSQELQIEAEKMLTSFYKMYPNDRELTNAYVSMLSEAALNKEEGYKYIEALKRLKNERTDMSITIAYANTLAGYSWEHESSVKPIVMELWSLWKQHQEVEELAEALTDSLASMATTQNRKERQITQNTIRKFMILYPGNETIKNTYEKELRYYECEYTE